MMKEARMIGTVFPYRPWWSPLAFQCTIIGASEGLLKFTHWWPSEIPEEMRPPHGLTGEKAVHQALLDHDGVYLTQELWLTRAPVEWFRDTVRSGLPGADHPFLLNLARMELRPRKIAA